MSYTSEAGLFAQRLREAMLSAGLKVSPTVLSHEFNLRYWGRGISVHAARNWLMGKSLPMQDKLIVLADCLKVNASELRFGVSDYSKNNLSDGVAKSLSMQDRAMLEAYTQLNEEKQILVRQLIHAV